MPVSLLTIELLGPPRISLSGQPRDVRVRKELALLAYLAVEQQHGHSRETLVGLLWPDEPEEAARNNLRVVLAGLRRLLGAAGSQFVQADRQRVQLVPGGDCTLDVLTFRRLLDEVRAHAHVADERCDTCIAWLSEAAALYRGDFLQGFLLPDSAPFEEWAAVVREQLHQGQLDALHSLAVACEQCGDYSAQVAYGRQQLALEPWRESAHAQVMRGLWASGQRGAALEQYEACRRILDAELGLHPAPELTALYEQLRAGERDRPLTRQPVQAAAHLPQQPQLPIAPAALLGRTNDVAAVARLLADPTCRLVTVYGPGGVGKTRLALYLAAMLRDTFRDGVAFVSLASVSEPALVSAAIAQALELREQVDQPVLATLTRAVRNRHMLLVLDNFEQVLAASPLVADLLQSAPQLSVLVTSRAVLHLSAERSFALAPLALPDPDEHSIEQLAQSPAVQLFVERVQAVKPGFHLSAEDGATVAAICARLDGLPLAIELAAARARMFTFPALLARLGNSLQLLTGGSRDLPARQQTLRAAIAWSYVLLDPNEQALLRWMSVCRRMVA